MSYGSSYGKMGKIIKEFVEDDDDDSVNEHS